MAARELWVGIPGGSTRSTPKGLSPTRARICASSSLISWGKAAGSAVYAISSGIGDGGDNIAHHGQIRISAHRFPCVPHKGVHTLFIPPPPLVGGLYTASVLLQERFFANRDGRNVAAAVIPFSARLRFACPDLFAQLLGAHWGHKKCAFY